MGLAVVAVSVGGVIALLAFFAGRDDATTGAGGDAVAAQSAEGPGRADPSAESPLLRAGNVELRYARAADRAALTALATRLAGADGAALRAAGGAVVVVRDPAAPGIVARAWHRTLTVAAPDDPALQAFVEGWLGQGG